MNSDAYEPFASISDDEWRDILPKLERHALSVSRKLRWRTRNPVDLPGGETVDSIVSKAIEKVLVGERKWDPQKEPDITKYLCGAIDSLLNHLSESQDNVLVTAQPKRKSPDYPAWESGSRKYDPAVNWLVRDRPSPENDLLQREQATSEDRAVELLFEECVDDAVLTAVLEAMMDGYDKPSEISVVKRIPVKDVYNTLKRMDRKLEIVRKRIAEENCGSRGGRGTI